MPRTEPACYIDFAFGFLRRGDGEVVAVFAVGRDVADRHLKRSAPEVNLGT